MITNQITTSTDTPAGRLGATSMVGEDQKAGRHHQNRFQNKGKIKGIKKYLKKSLKKTPRFCSPSPL
jgi:hypothetical protein